MPIKWVFFPNDSLNIVFSLYDIEGEDVDGQASARPRRLSEFKIAIKVVPIPQSSSFFVFSPTNR